MAHVGVIDLDMLAVDMAKMLDRYSYEIDASADDIRPHLDGFIAKIQATAAESAAQLTDEPGSDAATWAPQCESVEPTPQSSRRPRMTYMDWRKSQLVMLGATDVNEHYWQCPYTGCKVWAGPYGDPITAKKAGFEHIYTAHADAYFRR